MEQFIKLSKVGRNTVASIVVEADGKDHWVTV